MKRSIENIYKYVNNFYDIDIKEKTREDEFIICRAFFYYLTLKYCTDVVNFNVLSRFVNIQHGCVINSFTRVDEMEVYDKDNHKRLQYLENEFIKHFNIKENEFNLPVSKKEVLLLNHRYKYNRNKNKELQLEVNRLTSKLRSIKKAISNIQ